jgi:cell division protein FtsQ
MGVSTVDNTKLYEERLDQEKKKTPSRLIPLAMILLFLAGTCFGFLKSSFFLVEQIDVLGLTTIPSNEITLLSDYVKGINIFDVDLVELSEKIEAHPKVDKVSIQRKLPSTLVLNVTERAQVAVMPYSGYYVLVDTEGFAMAITESYGAHDPPLITGVKPQQVLVGKRIECPGLDSILRVATVLPPNLAREVSEITYSDATGVSIYLQSGTWVTLGTGSEEEYFTRLDVLYSLLLKLDEENRHATYIDVRFPKRPVIRDKN